MKINNIKLMAIAVLVAFSAFNCSDDDDSPITGAKVLISQELTHRKIKWVALQLTPFL